MPELYPASAPYRDQLLPLAADLGRRLLPAFDSPSGIPYGTVNLRHGVSSSESEVASTAGAGSLALEFGVLSMLTGDQRYARLAYGAAQRLFSARSAAGLVGKHVNIRSLGWTERTAGIGYNADSYYGAIGTRLT